MFLRRRWTLVLCVLAAVVLIVGVLPSPALRDAETLGPVNGAHLVLSPAFVVLAPLNNTLDAVSLLTVPQHLALLATLGILYVVWRGMRGFKSVLAEVWAAVLALIALIGFYAIGILVPRPMAAIALASPDALAIDFHSHTSASHDGRKGFDLAANLRWHARAGFDAAYISDHSRFLSRIALSGHPLALGAVECIVHHEHLVVLGVTSADSSALLRGDRDCDASAAASHLSIETIPGHIDAIPEVQAIEISDAAPRGLAQLDLDRPRVLALADRLGLAVVSASDNHGWGWTAAAWSVMVVPGWRTMAPDAVERAVEQTIRTRRRHAVTVIERVRPTTVEAIGPALAWTVLSTRSWAERVSWAVWLLVMAAISARRGA